MGCTLGLDMYIGSRCIGDWDCDKASSITYITHDVMTTTCITYKNKVTQMQCTFSFGIEKNI